ncbi:MAG: methyltransferase domain-containing protein [Pyrinomonadaceae bacterium]
MTIGPIDRFSSRVDNYIKYRPGYPIELVLLLERECGLTTDSVIADIGSGTGKLSEPFLQNGNFLYGVEPNARMRTAAEGLLSRYHRFASIDATAEKTSLQCHAVDFVIAGQAFHWFKHHDFRNECLRILKPGGWIVLVWNERQLATTPFLQEYERILLKYGRDYEAVRHENARNRIAEFFSPATPREKTFANEQKFDFEGLKGRVMSSSYTPEPPQPSFTSMLKDLTRAFEKHQTNNRVCFLYDTRVYYGRLDS